MAQLQKKFIADNAVDENKIRLGNEGELKARNAADSADVNILKVNSDDRIEFDSVPKASGAPADTDDLTNKDYVDGQISTVSGATAAVADDVSHLVTLSGVAVDSNDLGTFTGSTIPDTSTVKGALQSLETAIETLPDPMEYKGVWAASTNTPTLADGTGNNGDVYQVTDSGTVDFGSGGIAFDAGDKVVYSGTTAKWEKWDMTDAVTSVNGQSGAVSLALDDLSDVNAPTPSDGDALTWDSGTSSWIASPAASPLTGGDMITISSDIVSVDLLTNGGLKSSNPGNAAGQLEIALEASNPSLQVSGSNELGLKIDGSGGLQKGASGVSIKSDTSTANTIGITSTSNGAGVKFDSNSFADSGSETLALASGVAGAGLALTSGVLSVNVDNSTIEINTDTLRVKDLGITAAKLSSGAATAGQVATADGSGNVTYVSPAASIQATEQMITLSGTDITNQYVDLAHAVQGSSASANSVSVNPVGGPEQLKAVDYTVSLTGGSGGVTRIALIGDLGTGGASELIAGDILMIKYSY